MPCTDTFLSILEMHYMYMVKILSNCKSLHHLTYYLILFLVFILDINLLNSLIIFNVRQKYFAAHRIISSRLSEFSEKYWINAVFESKFDSLLAKVSYLVSYYEFHLLISIQNLIHQSRITCASTDEPHSQATQINLQLAFSGQLTFSFKGGRAPFSHSNKYLTRSIQA